MDRQLVPPTVTGFCLDLALRLKRYVRPDTKEAAARELVLRRRAQSLESRDEETRGSMPIGDDIQAGRLSCRQIHIYQPTDEVDVEDSLPSVAHPRTPYKYRSLASQCKKRLYVVAR